MEPGAQQITTAALERLAALAPSPDWKQFEVFFETPKLAPDCVVRLTRKGTGFLGRGAPAPDSPPQNLEIEGSFAAGVLHELQIDLTMSVTDPATNPSVEYFLASDSVSDTDACEVMLTADQVAPAVLELLASDTFTVR